MSDNDIVEVSDLYNLIATNSLTNIRNGEIETKLNVSLKGKTYVFLFDSKIKDFACCAITDALYCEDSWMSEDPGSYEKSFDYSPVVYIKKGKLNCDEERIISSFKDSHFLGMIFYTGNTAYVVNAVKAFNLKGKALLMKTFFPHKHRKQYEDHFVLFYADNKISKIHE